MGGKARSRATSPRPQKQVSKTAASARAQGESSAAFAPPCLTSQQILILSLTQSFRLGDSAVNLMINWRTPLWVGEGDSIAARVRSTLPKRAVPGAPKWEEPLARAGGAGGRPATPHGQGASKGLTWRQGPRANCLGTGRLPVPWRSRSSLNEYLIF